MKPKSQKVQAQIEFNEAKFLLIETLAYLDPRQQSDLRTRIEAFLDQLAEKERASHDL